MKTFEFPLVLVGFGDDAEEAWDNACEGFQDEPGPTPEDFTVTEIEDVVIG